MRIGLGEATAQPLHCAGAKVVVADVADAKGKTFESELGLRDTSHRCDVGGLRQRGDRRGRLRAPLRISGNTHGGPATGDRLVAKDGSP